MLKKALVEAVPFRFHYNMFSMQCGLATTMLELLPRSAWTRFVASNLRHGATKRSHVAN